MWVILSVVFEKQRHCGTLWSNFFVSANYPFCVYNTDRCYEHITGGANIYLIFKY